MRYQGMVGEHIAYQIEFQYAETASEQYRGRWYQRELSPKSFGERHPNHGESWDKICPLFKEYGANGRLWQSTGMHGFRDRDLAERAFAAVALAHRGERCRLVRRTITIQREVLADVFHAKEDAPAVG